MRALLLQLNSSFEVPGAARGSGAGRYLSAVGGCGNFNSNAHFCTLDGERLLENFDGNERLLLGRLG